LLVASQVAPKIATFGSDEAYELHDALLHHEGHNAIALGPTVIAGLSAIALLIIDGAGNLAGLFTVIGLAGVIGVALSTRIGAIPVNDRIRELKGQSGRPDYVELQRSWRRAHLVRTVSGAVAFLSFTAAAIAA
jgi:hypothetical protein